MEILLLTFMLTSLSLIPLLTSMYMLLFNSYIIIKIPLINMLSINMSADIIMDWMSMSFMSTVMFISSMIIMFSTYYIPTKEQKQFLMLLLMFILSMNILIISNNILLILLGWDGLGLSSYILVIYYQNSISAASGSITLLSNRLGDILILLSMSLLLISMNWNFSLNHEYSLLSIMFLMLAACSKSAQFPFSAWLPMAMAAPTPISALVHSSTLVTAGIFIMLRLTSNLHPTSMLLLMMISSATALYASMSANWEQDLKKIIALSTLSQIAMMMFAISINSSMLAFLHLIIHALFKSTMFLCAGIMIHESSYQDMRMMGFNNMNFKLTQSILGLTSMALMGIPFMSGFFSKDAIIDKLMSYKMESLLSMMMIISIGMTTMYSIRMSFLSNKPTFKHSPDSNNHTNNNSNIPISILSFMAITSGSSMTWFLSPEQMFLTSQNQKLSILIMIALGFVMGFMLAYKNKNYLSMGFSSISLWFTHLITTHPMPLLSPMMLLFKKTDSSWQELYGPQQHYSLITNLSYIPEIMKLSMMMLFIMILIIPMMLL